MPIQAKANRSHSRRPSAVRVGTRPASAGAGRPDRGFPGYTKMGVDLGRNIESGRREADPHRRDRQNLDGVRNLLGPRSLPAAPSTSIRTRASDEQGPDLLL
jgi:hypothetical protein